MENSYSCKGCESSVQVSPDEINNILHKTIKVKKIKIVPKRLYNERLQHCLKCSDLVYNTTCKYCGCLIHVKAKLVNAKCPYPFNSKW